MNPRFFILASVAGVLAVMLAVKVSQPAPAATDDNENESTGPPSGDLEVLMTNICDRTLTGREAPEPPEFDVQVAVSNASGKNRLNFWVTEAHGYYVQGFRILFWYKEEPDMSLEDSPLVIDHFFDNHILANDTLDDCLEIVPAELLRIDGAIGTSANWEAKVQWHCRTRLENPDPLPLLKKAHSCG